MAKYGLYEAVDERSGNYKFMARKAKSKGNINNPTTPVRVRDRL